MVNKRAKVPTLTEAILQLERTLTKKQIGSFQRAVTAWRKVVGQNQTRVDNIWQKDLEDFLELKTHQPGVSQTKM